MTSHKQHRIRELLMLKARTALIDGKTPYLLVGDSILVEITSDGVEEAFKQAEDIVRGDYSQIAYGDQNQPNRPVIFKGNITDDKSYEHPIARLFADHPHASIQSIQELDALVREYTKTNDYWARSLVFREYLQNLPIRSQEGNVFQLRSVRGRDIAVSLLEAGELPFVPEEAEEYLKRQGLKPEEIEALYPKEERARRASVGNFERVTGTKVEAIKSLDDLDASVSRVTVGPKWTVYCDYLRSLPKRGTPNKLLDEIVVPLSGRQDYWVQRAALETLRRLDYMPKT